MSIIFGLSYAIGLGIAIFPIALNYGFSVLSTFYPECGPGLPDPTACPGLAEWNNVRFGSVLLLPGFGSTGTGIIAVTALAQLIGQIRDGYVEFRTLIPMIVLFVAGAASGILGYMQATHKW